MNSSPSLYYYWGLPQIPEIWEVFNDGYYHVFEKNRDGNYRCLSNPARVYLPEELHIEQLPNRTRGVNVFRMAAKDQSYTGVYYTYAT
jgi:hypothetical protein